MAVLKLFSTIYVPDVQSAGPLPKLKGFYLSNAKLFVSAIQTATGSAQNVAHGLGAVPAAVLISCTDNSGSSDVFTVTEGTHTSTNVVVTVTASAKFKVLAWL